MKNFDFFFLLARFVCAVVFVCCDCPKAVNVFGLVKVVVGGMAGVTIELVVAVFEVLKEAVGICVGFEGTKKPVTFEAGWEFLERSVEEEEEEVVILAVEVVLEKL